MALPTGLGSCGKEVAYFRPNVVSVLASLVPSRSLLPRCPRELWKERACISR